MSIGSVSFKYTINNFNIEKNFDTRVNVKSELEYLRFGSSFSNQGLGLSYITSPGIDSDKNILLIDKSNGITINAKENQIEQEFNTDNFIIDYAGFSITDVVKTIDGEVTPLYYWHDMSEVVSFNNLEILDGNKKPVDPKLWSFYDETATLGYNRKGIYSNFICNISKKENRYEIYYVRYKDLLTNIVVEKLLDSKLFYEQAAFESVRSKREYILTQVGNSYNVNIVFDSLNFSPTPLTNSHRYWLKRRSQSKITLEKPGIVSPSERWNMKISPGDFFKNDLKYWIPEYYLQLFSPTFPYKLVKEKEAVVINKNIIYIDSNPIADLSVAGYYIYIIIKEPNDAVKACYTNDPDADTYVTKQGFVTDIFYEKNVIKSISAGSGFIELNKSIPEGMKVYVTCRYIERFYSYDYISVNPSINPEILGKRIVFYVVPGYSDRAVHHLSIDANEIIQDASIESNIGLSYSNWLGHAVTQGYFEIGDVYVTQNLSIPDISLLDTRILGGGVSDKNLGSALKLQNEVSWYWDIGNWDGTAYPGMGAIIVHLPRYILKELGGEFERDQVLQIVKRHAAAGSYIIIKYYDESTEIKSILPGDKQAEIEWYMVNANSYNIYLGSSPDNLTLYSTQPGTRTKLLISNLDNDKIYYVQVSPIVGGIERLPSRVLGFMPFNYSSTLPPIKYGENKFIEGSYV
jgi:hypothetical protein